MVKKLFYSYMYKYVSVFWRLNESGDSLQKDLYDENKYYIYDMKYFYKRI